MSNNTTTVKVDVSLSDLTKVYNALGSEQFPKGKKGSYISERNIKLLTPHFEDFQNFQQDLQIKYSEEKDDKLIISKENTVKINELIRFKLKEIIEIEIFQIADNEELKKLPMLYRSVLLGVVILEEV